MTGRWTAWTDCEACGGDSAEEECGRCGQTLCEGCLDEHDCEV